jgi:hypothetical protein
MFTQNTRYFCRILIKIELSRQTFEKELKYEVSSKSVQWEPNFSMRTDRRKDGRTYEANILGVPDGVP